MIYFKRHKETRNFGKFRIWIIRVGSYLSPVNFLLILLFYKWFELINLYKVVRDYPGRLIKELKTYRVSEKEYYYHRDIDPLDLKEIERAARFVYLNKICYNGLYRVNKSGKFNVPYGRNENVRLIDEENINATSAVLRNTELYCGDYISIVEHYAKKGDFIYLDPPYYPAGGYSDFKRYTKEFFYESQD